MVKEIFDELNVTSLNNLSLKGWFVLASMAVVWLVLAAVWFVLAAVWYELAAARPVKSLSVASNHKKKAVPSKQVPGNQTLEYRSLRLVRFIIKLFYFLLQNTSN